MQGLTSDNDVLAGTLLSNNSVSMKTFVDYSNIQLRPEILHFKMQGRQTLLGKKKYHYRRVCSVKSSLLTLFPFEDPLSFELLQGRM